MIWQRQRFAGRSDIWGVTAYFNPIGFRRRLENYRHFRANLSVPLVAVELATNGRFELNETDADILIRCDATDVLWQRERMINLALAAVPSECQKIARLDCDIIFENDSWSELASRQLDEHAFVQLFTEAYDQPRDYVPGSCGGPDRSRAWASFASRWQTGREPSLIDRRGSNAATRSNCAMGLAWAFRRELHSSLRIYDACILGGAEHAILAAACGVPELVVDYQRMGAARSRHYLDWANEFHGIVGGALAAVPGRVLHLWHGEIKHRGYGARYQNFTDFDFDPARDLMLNQSGVWKWAHNNAAMKTYVEEYFASRREDG